MLECLILGDSIAVGVSKYRPECTTHAKVGINSHNWNSKYNSIDTNAKLVVISLGTNDPTRSRTYDELEIIRKKIHENTQVFWILPANNEVAQNAVYLIASEYRDGVLGIQKLSDDKIHPTSKEYKRLAEVTK
jgi:lysophospholipase L1-like esterase